MLSSNQDRSITARRGYSTLAHGQIHWRMWEPDAGATLPDLYCLHPAPFSGLAFENIAPLLAQGRRVIAPDYPGYGGSDPLPSAPSIGDFAQAVLDLIARLSPDGPVEFLGFHTGCLIAVECARIAPDRVGQLCLIDIPARDEAENAQQAQQMPDRIEFTPEVECLDAMWKQCFVKRLEPQGEAQALAFFTENLRGGKRANEAFLAAYAYPWRERFAQVNTDITVMATQSALREGTLAASAVLPGARLIDAQHITRSVLDESAPVTARLVQEALTAPKIGADA